MKFQVDKLYAVYFYDHAIGIDEAIICEVFGRVVKEDDINVVISTWRVLNGDEQTRKDNIEITVIVKSTIIKQHKISFRPNFSQKIQRLLLT